MQQLQDILQAARQIARMAGEVHLQWFRNPDLAVKAKLNESDIVTAADGQAEQLIISEIHHRFLDHAILSEESAWSGDMDEKAEAPRGWRWVIDPLDGTTNFASGLPAFCVSIAVEYDGEALVGVVYAPYLQEMFVAVKGEGAYLNNRPITCPNLADPSRAVVATGFPVDKNTSDDNNMQNLCRLLPQVRGIRRLGSAALDLSYVAAGFLNAYWELNLHRWDIAAGGLIAREAGAQVSFIRPIPEAGGNRNYCIAASAPSLHSWLLSLLK